MTKFQKGDVVRCVKGEGATVAKGMVFTVAAEESARWPFIGLQDERVLLGTYNPARFELVSRMEERKTVEYANVYKGGTNRGVTVSCIRHDCMALATAASKKSKSHVAVATIVTTYSVPVDVETPKMKLLAEAQEALRKAQEKLNQLQGES